MNLPFNPRRGIYIDIAQESSGAAAPLPAAEAAVFERFDLVYRSLCALLYNYVPMSGHPGGSISTGRALAGILFNVADYDLADPLRADADIVSFAAGHKALGLYAMWALRDEIARLGAPELLPQNEAHRLRLEDLLGFRRNPLNATPLFVEKRSKPLDGHPTPATPFVRLSTGASGVGVGASLGLAFAARDVYGHSAPRVHILEGEGGMTPGRVGEAMAAAATSSIGNAIMHVDWNQASIDSNRVCRDGAAPGDYVQWTPAEFAWLHDWNVIFVADGLDVQQVAAAQRRAIGIDNGQPTAVISRTTKGWRYGIEGKASHGAGHALCCDAFYEALRPLSEATGAVFPRCCNAVGEPLSGPDTRCRVGADASVVEGCFWEALTAIRQVLSEDKELVSVLAGRLRDARGRLAGSGRRPRPGAPDIAAAYRAADAGVAKVPDGLALPPGHKTTLRGELGRALNHLNAASGGAVLAAAADLYGSTSISTAAKGFADGFFNAEQNPEARLLSLGGICEDGMAGILSGVATFGHHLGVGSSYGAFSAPLGHIAARLHAIGSQARQAVDPGPYHPFFLVCAHAGVKTGEDGPTHADPQALQLLQGNFPVGTMVTLTPWDPAEVWTLVAAAVAARPAVIAPFVTRPTETVPDREALGLAPARMAAQGVYKLHAAEGAAQGVVVLQGSEAAYGFVDALPRLREAGIEVDAYYVASAELFDRLPEAEREAVFPESEAMRAMGVTGFTLPTMERWVRSDLGRRRTLHPFRAGHFLGSGRSEMVVAEAGLDGAGQFEAIRAYVAALKG